MLAKHGGLDIGPKWQESSHVDKEFFTAAAQRLSYLNPSSLRAQRSQVLS